MTNGDIWPLSAAVEWCGIALRKAIQISGTGFCLWNALEISILQERYPQAEYFRRVM